jgi:hypothetical protein
MDLPVEVINAVKEDKQLSLDLPKSRKPYVKKLTKRILHAIGNGLRTATSVSNALGVDKTKIQSNLWHMKAKGLIHASKQEGKAELKYHLTTDKPVLGQLDLTIKKKARKPYTKQAKVVKVVKVVNVVSAVEPTAKPSYVRQLENRVEELVATNNAIQAELIHAQAECFDLKAVIKYLERKGN